MQRIQGSSNLLSDEFLVKVKDVITGVRMSGVVISRKMVITIDTEVIEANCQSKLKDFGGHMVLTKVWASGVLKSIEWSKRKGATSKIKPKDQFLVKEKLTFQRRLSSIIQEYGLPEKLFLNNTLVISFPWELHFQSKRCKDSDY